MSCSPFSNIIYISDFFALYASVIQSKGQTLSLILNVLRIKSQIKWIKNVLYM